MKKYAETSHGRELKNANKRARYKANHEIVRKKANEYTRLNKDRAYKQASEWKKRNKEHVLKYNKAYRAAADQEKRKAYMRAYKAAADPEINKAQCKKYYAKVVAHLDSFKQSLNDGHCNHAGCTIEWQACDIDHIFASRKGKSFAKWPTIKNINDEIKRNTDPDGTIQLQLLCVIHHRMKTYNGEGHSDRKKTKIYSDWRELQHKCAKCKLTVHKLPLWCFDADHINRIDKVETISTMVVDCSYTGEQVTEELQKCRMLCANCHRCFTAQQMGWRWADEAFWIMGSL